VENVHFGASCSVNEVQIYKSLFQEFCDVFTWSYEEMSVIDPDIVVHEIKTYLDSKLIRQILFLFVYYRDINKDCTKDNYPTPFVNQIIDDFVGSEIFSSSFSGYNQINILPTDQHKISFIYPWGTFSY
jgi:hypothetical protein